MSDKKEIGFDILENANLEQIEEIGMDCDMLDDKAKQRIQEIIRRKYNEAKVETKMNDNKYIDNENSVSDVEIYKERKITKIISRVVSIAAVFGIVAGGAALVRNNKIKTENINKTSSSASSSVSPDAANEYEKAAQKIFDDLFIRYNVTEFNYDFVDFKGDSAPELFISIDAYEEAKELIICEYKNSEYNIEYQNYYYNLMLSIDNNSFAIIVDPSYDICFYDCEPNKEKILSTSDDNLKIFNQYKNHEYTVYHIFENNVETDYYSAERADDSTSEEYIFNHNIEDISEEEYNKTMDKYDSYGWTELIIDKYTAKPEKITHEEAIIPAIENLPVDLSVEVEYIKEFNYKLIDVVGDSTPELFVSFEDELAGISHLFFGEFNDYFYSMNELCTGNKFMVSEENNAIAYTYEGYYIDSKSDYVETTIYNHACMVDFTPNETIIKADGEIIFNQYEKHKPTHTSISHYTKNDRLFTPISSYIAKVSEENSNESFKFYDCTTDEELYLSKELYIEKMNELDSYGWSEINFEKYIPEPKETNNNNTNTTADYETAAKTTIDSLVEEDDAEKEYKLVDLNNDAVPEMIAKITYSDSDIRVHLCTYDNGEYFAQASTVADYILYCTDTNSVATLRENEEVSTITIFTMEEENSFSTIDEYTREWNAETESYEYKHNGESIDNEEYERINNELDYYSWSEFGQ